MMGFFDESTIDRAVAFLPYGKASHFDRNQGTSLPFYEQNDKFADLLI
jgi:hypothetical protein